MKKRRSILYFVVVIFASAHFVSGQSLQREVKKTNEIKVNIKISSSFGSLNVSKGDPDKIAQIYFRKKEKDKEPNIELDYYIRNNIGELQIELHPENMKHSNRRSVDVDVQWNGGNFRTDEWYVSLSDALPLNIEAELGAGKCNFDLSGLQITDLSISTGASKSLLTFEEKNKAEIDVLRIETGVSKFTAEKLNNANFKRMTFESGVGSYYLDFSGELVRTVDVDINVGLGAITIVIPRKIGVKVRYEDSWLSNFSIDDEFVRKRKGTYESENYDSATGRMNISIESGLGSVKVKRSR